MEDDPNDAELLERVVRRGGFEPRSERAADEAALDRALREREWDVVIADHHVPGLDVLDVLARVRAVDDPPPCIVVSGVVTEETAVAALRAGAKDFVVKDRPARLVPAIERELAAVRRRRRHERALRASQLRFDAVVRNLTEGVLVTDLDDKVLYVNPRFEALTGWRAEEAMGRVAAELLLPEDARPALRERLSARRRGESETYELEQVHRDGHTYWVEIGAGPLRDADGEIVGTVSIMNDVTERRRTEARLAQLNRDLQASAEAYRGLAEFSTEIEGMVETEALIDRGMERLLAILKLDAAAYYARCDGAWCVTSLLGELPAEAEALVIQPIPDGEGVVGETGRTGASSLCVDYPSSSSARPAWVAAGLRTQVTFPAKRAGRVEGIVSLASFGRAVDLDEKDLAVARLFVRRLENALERADYIAELRATRRATFRALGLALEYRDYETKGHTDRVVELSRRFGIGLGLEKGDLEALEWGAYLHDVGKVSISDSILLKPGRLDAAEWTIVRQHTVYGYEMTRDIGFLPDATRAVIRSHHERWDGTGYPDGLAGEAIPLQARMFALVDVYDALTSVRPYKRAWSEAEAVAELRAQAGEQFDPELVPVFLRTIGAGADG